MAVGAINLWNADEILELLKASSTSLQQFYLGLGKSQVRDLFSPAFETMTSTRVDDEAPSIRGTTATYIWTDELQVSKPIRVRPPVAIFRDARYPHADVSVEEEMLDKRHPLNPNPEGGTLTQWVIVAGGKRSKPLRSMAVAKAAAKALHERLADALDEEAKERMPTYGAFG